MQIEQRETGSKGAFFINVNGDQLAEMTYSLTDSDILIIDHTEVDDSLRGQNIGMQLVEHAVEYARKTNRKIIPLCPFAKSVFDRKKELFSDVLR
ncbi:MAG: GNAT family N-acetyltransferase [Ferruginibacter sp.]